MSNPSTETKFVVAIAKWAQRIGGKVTKLHGHAMQRKGIPDLWIATPRFFGWVEAKMGSNKSSFHQAAFLEESMSSGCPGLEVSLRSDGRVQFFIGHVAQLNLQKIRWDSHHIHTGSFENYCQYPREFFDDLLMCCIKYGLAHNPDNAGLVGDICKRLATYNEV